MEGIAKSGKIQRTYLTFKQRLALANFIQERHHLWVKRQTPFNVALDEVKRKYSGVGYTKHHLRIMAKELGLQWWENFPRAAKATGVGSRGGHRVPGAVRLLSSEMCRLAQSLGHELHPDIRRIAGGRAKSVGPTPDNLALLGSYLLDLYRAAGEKPHKALVERGTQK